MPILLRSRPAQWKLRKPPVIGSAADTIALTAPVANQFRWWGSARVSASLTISGTYAGTVTNIEWSSDGSSWATLVSSPAGGTFSSSVTLAAGQYTISVRFSNSTGVSTSVTPVSVGPVITLLGISQPNRGTSNQTNVYDPHSFIHAQKTATGYAALADPVGVTVDSQTTGTGWISMVGSLCEVLNAPIGLVPAMQGGQSITTFLSGQANYTYLVAATQAVGGADAVIAWIGQVDALNLMSTATYHTNLANMVASLRSDLGNVPVISPTLEHQDPSFVTQPGQDNINAAIVAGWSDITGLIQGPDLRKIPTLPEDNAHFRTDQKLALAGGIWAATLYKRFYQPATVFGGSRIVQSFGTY